MFFLALSLLNAQLLLFFTFSYLWHRTCFFFLHISYHNETWWRVYTICTRSLDPFYLSYCIKWVSLFGHTVREGTERNILFYFPTLCLYLLCVIITCQTNPIKSLSQQDKAGPALAAQSPILFRGKLWENWTKRDFVSVSHEAGGRCL